MKITYNFFLVLIFVLMLIPRSWAGQSDQGGLQTFSGEVMDSLCAKDKSHAKMMEEMKSMRNDPAVCSKKCVELGAKYVLYDRQKDMVYALADQDKAEEFAGHKVRISGTIEKKKIKIANIESTDSGSQKSK
jgi:hypothetical protein